MIRFHLTAIPALVFAVAPAYSVGLPDSGQNLCDNGANVLVACDATNTGDAATYPRQDGRFGRDAKAAAGTLTKNGAGAVGLDYTKVANNGSDLAADAVLGTAANQWACTRDNVTGLTWEVKTAGTSDLRYAGHAYAWYSTESSTNGGSAGSTGANTCNATLASGQCNTQAFVAAVNASALCSYGDWRVPTQRELLTLVHAGALNFSIEPTYFPNSVAWAYWSATSYVAESSAAWGVSFANGVAGASDKTTNFYLRLVRGDQF